jgi:hypothetical protein
MNSSSSSSSSMLSPLLPAEMLSSASPSAREGVSARVEFLARAFGVSLVRDYCVALRSAPAVRATASVLLQRFYHARGVREFAPAEVAMGAVFLAGKAEEDARRMRDVVSVAFACEARRRGRGRGGGGGGGGGGGAAQRVVELGGARYTALKVALARAERFLLRAVGFQVHAGVCAQHAQRFLLFFVRVLGGGGALARRAWAALDDAAARDLCVRHAPEAIACAAITIAARETRFALPCDAPWTRVFGTPAAEADRVAAAILQVRELRAGAGARLFNGWFDVEAELAAEAAAARPAPAAEGVEHARGSR